MREEVIQKIEAEKIIAIVRGVGADQCMKVADALYAGGIRLMEVTFDQKNPASFQATADAIEAIGKAYEGRMLVGAGTVINLEQCKLAVSMGARFIVSPGYSEEIVSWCVENNIPVTPGCVTPTEIMAAVNHGLKVIKFFPANVYGGLNAMKNLSAPFVGLKFLPTGGVNTANIREYIDAPFVHAVGGSWVCPKAEIAAGNFEKITQLCREARKAALEG